MTVTAIGGNLSIGAAVPVAADAAAAVDAMAMASLPGLTANMAGYTALLLPSPSFDIGLQAAQAVAALAQVTAEVAGIPGVGVGLAGALTAAVSAQQAAQLAIKGVDPDLALKVDAALASIASLNVQVSSGVTGPNVNLALVTKVLGELEAVKATLDAQLALAGEISANLSVGGLKAYRFDGDLATAGAELQAQITADGLSGEFHFVVLLPTTDAAWNGLQATIKTS
jgi:hypothetical protein